MCFPVWNCVTGRRPVRSPRFEITDRRIIWQSPVAFTPLTDVDTLDEAALDALIRGWYAEAGVRPEDVETGAVIVTGESLKP